METRAILSIVVPSYNEEDNLDPLYERIAATMAPLDMAWELILVDDGSTDGTVHVMRALHERDPRVKAVLLSRNFGHEIASTAGLDAAQGDAVILMDADLQDPPEFIPLLVAKWREGFDVICAQRASREGESIFKRTTAYLFYRLMDALVGWTLPNDTGDFRLMSRGALNAFLRCRERNRFVRALVAWTGFRQATVPFEREARHAGKTKYNSFQLFALAITSMTSFSVAPLRIATWMGLIITALSLVFLIAIGIMGLRGFEQPGFAFLAGSIWFLGGVQCLLVGILGEYVGRTYVESQHRPLYFVRETLGTAPPPDAVLCSVLGGECVRPRCPTHHLDQGPK